MKNEVSKNEKKLVIARLILSILHFIPAFLFVVVGFALNIIWVIGGTGSSNGSGADVSRFVTAIVYTSLISIIPSLIVLVLFILMLIFTVNYFKNKNKKVLELIVCFAFSIIDMILLIIFISSSLIILSIITLISLILFILGIIKNFKKQKSLD